MKDDTKKDLFTLGMQDSVLKYFKVIGPFTNRKCRSEVMFGDFSDGPDVNISTSSSITLQEKEKLAERIRHQGDLYYRRGQDAGDDLITFLANSGRFEQHIRSQWWYRWGCKLRRIFFQNPLDLWRKMCYTVGGFVTKSSLWINSRRPLSMKDLTDD